MADVSISVNGRAYTVTCDDGQEARLQQLGAHLDGQMRKLAGEVGQIGDARLMLLAALTLCDDLLEAQTKLASLEGAADILDEETMGGAARVVDAAARRVDAIAERIEESS
ncbi:MAG: cell division protein ZapA [Pseudomonadota bacterium]